MLSKDPNLGAERCTFSEESLREAKIEAAIQLVVEGSTVDERVLGITRLGTLKARVDLIRNAAWSKSGRMRAAGAAALGRFADPHDLDRLEQLTSDLNGYVRTGACQGLGFGQFVAAVPLLFDILQDPNEVVEVRANAVIAVARALAGVSEEPRFLGDTADLLSQAEELHAQGVLRLSDYCRALGSLGSEKSRIILEDLTQEALLSGLTNTRDAYHMLNALKRQPLSERGLELVVLALDGLPGGRTEAARALSRWPTERARAGLERLLRDPSEQLVGAAVNALCAIGLTPSLPALAPVFANDNSTASHAIGQLIGSDGAEFAEQLLRSGCAGLRHHALHRMVALDPKRGMAVAEAYVTDPNARVRAAAYRCLIAGADEPLRWRKLAKNDPVAWVASEADFGLAG